MSKIENIVQHILDTQPHTHGNNTELCIAVWIEVANRRGEMTWDIMRDYPPESITRKRRELVKSTKEQHEKGYQVYK
jgi:hypothetical protein